MKRVLSAMLCSAIAVSAFAFNVPNKLAPLAYEPTIEKIEMPAIEMNQVVSELDEVYSDSIAYADRPSTYFPSYLDYDAIILFSAYANMTVEAFHFNLKMAVQGATPDVPVTVYTVTEEGTLGAEVFSQTMTATDNRYFSYEFVIAEEDQFDIEGGKDYVLKIGSAGPNWHVLADGGTENSRNSVVVRQQQGGQPTETMIDSDWCVSVLGTATEDYINLEVTSLYNNVTLYNIKPSTDVTFSAKVRNVGNIDVTEGSVKFDVYLQPTDDEEPEIIFTNSVELTETLTARGVGEAVIVSSEAWTACDEAGRYIVSVEVTAPESYGERALYNNKKLLQQRVIGEDRWYAYDSGECSTLVSGSWKGYTQVLRPTSYPAILDSISMYNAQTTPLNVDLMVLGPDASGAYAPMWQSSLVLVNGWNKFAIEGENISDGATIATGDFFVMIMTEASFAISLDRNQPVCAESYTDMHEVTLRYDERDGNFYYETFGNIMLRGKISGAAHFEVRESAAPINLGEGTPGHRFEGWLHIENTGDAAGLIDSVNVANNATNISVETEMPLEIAAGAQDSVKYVFTMPSEAGATNGALIVYPNDRPTNQPVLVIFQGTVDVEETGTELPTEYELAQNHPNPFNPETSIRFALKETGNVQLRIFNVMGREVASLVNQPMVAGTHSVTFNGQNFASGIYFYSIDVNGFHAMKKMILMK